MTESRVSIGRYGEKEVERFLKAQGMSIIRRGYRCLQGEVDLIAREDDVLCFVEVKTRSNKTFGSAAESVTPRKISRISYAALHYLNKRRLRNQKVRFDVVLVDISGKDNKKPRIEIIRGAFDSSFDV